ncbi:protein Shroom3-like [Clavelina lepadiformis]|uniref:ASD2 domain-containing protein n=1 Tax=Clavelina lepadiformis TaxID=159417 RepID=A0ABP0H0V0_CLALP
MILKLPYRKKTTLQDMAPKPLCVEYALRPLSPVETSCKLPCRRRRSRKRSRQEDLPASSAYYMTSVSKGKIMNLAKEKLANEEVRQESSEHTNERKIALILKINTKLQVLQNIKSLLKAEVKDNENLGKQTQNVVAQLCTAREQEKYSFFVHDVDNIINLTLSISSRLCRVENAIQMLPADASTQEKELLHLKRVNLTEQYNDANQLKENINRRQQTVSKILARYFSKEQFADFEHYIKMKIALITERRELDDKVRLGEEQMQCLKDSLPEDWQINLDKLLEEE